VSPGSRKRRPVADAASPHSRRQDRRLTTEWRPIAYVLAAMAVIGALIAIVATSPNDAGTTLTTAPVATVPAPDALAEIQATYRDTFDDPAFANKVLAAYQQGDVLVVRTGLELADDNSELIGLCVTATSFSEQVRVINSSGDQIAHTMERTVTEGRTAFICTDYWLPDPNRRCFPTRRPTLGSCTTLVNVCRSIDRGVRIRPSMLQSSGQSWAARTTVAISASNWISPTRMARRSWSLA
jgi:hypothetical protein